MTIFEYLEARGFALYAANTAELALWRQWYKGDVPSFHRYHIYNGRRHVPCRKTGLGMGRQVCEDWANILFNEQVHIAVEHEATHRFVNEVLERENLFGRINRMQEVKMYTGTVAYLPYADGVVVDGDGRPMGGGQVRVNCLSVPDILPLRVEAGECTECAFTAHTRIGASTYTHLQLCLLNEEGEYVVENHLFCTGGGAAEKVPLASVPTFAGIAPVWRTGSRAKPFALDTPGIAGNGNEDGYGQSILAGAVPILQALDTVFDSYVNEFVLGKKRVVVTAAAARTLEGAPVFDPNDVAYYQLPEDMGDTPFLKEIDMRLRAGEHQRALDDLLQLLSTRCGFGPDNYKYALHRTAVTKTATEVTAQRQTRQQTREKHLKVLDRALRDLVRGIAELGVQALGLPLQPGAAVHILHNDAVIEDHGTRLDRLRADAEAGLIRRELYVMAAYGATEVEAKQMMPHAKQAPGAAGGNETSDRAEE